jgi:hypothetical protein
MTNEIEDLLLLSLGGRVILALSPIPGVVGREGWARAMALGEVAGTARPGRRFGGFTRLA